MQIWPAIDLFGGVAVRLHQGAYDRVTEYGSPREIAAAWRGRSPRLHLVDLEAARTGVMGQLDAIAALVEAFDGVVQVGGGVRSLGAVHALASTGAARIIVGTAAIKDPALLPLAAEAYPDRIVLAVDAKNGMVATDGWTEVSKMTAAAVVERFVTLPLAGVLYTDVSRDGTGKGPNLVTTEALAALSRWPVLASGGVGSLEHVRALAARPRIAGVIVGRALHDRVFSIEDARATADDR